MKSKAIQFFFVRVLATVLIKLLFISPVSAQSVPQKPVNLVATPGIASVVLNWDNPVDTTITGYQIRDKVDWTDHWSPWTYIVSSDSTTVTHTVSGLLNGATYDFQIRAVNALGSGPDSEIVTVTLSIVLADLCDKDSVAVQTADNPVELAKDCNILLNIRDELSGTGSLNWSANLDMRDWTGITFGVRVENIRLKNLGLNGSIPFAIGRLAGLATLTIEDNLSGILPSSLGNLSNLERLELVFNKLSGPIPSTLGNLSSLKLLYLNNNMLSGQIPSSLGNLSALTELNLAFNQLSGTLPDSIGNLTNLVVLYVSNNALTGPIRSSLGNLVKLVDLRLDNNRFSGNIPDSLGNLTELYALGLQNNELTGELPESLGNLVKLTELLVDDNDLSGKIPDSFENLVLLRHLNLSNNMFDGPVPDFIKDILPELLFLQNNFFKNCLDAELKKLEHTFNPQWDRANPSNEFYLDECYGVVTPNSLTVTEGGYEEYTVYLSTQPSQDVDVNLSATGDSDITYDPDTLTFTLYNWTVPQTVRVSAAQDLDAIDGMATISHSASSDDQEFEHLIIESVAVTEDDDDVVGVSVTPTRLYVPEGTSSAYSVRLNTEPSADVTIAITRASDPDITASTSSLTFTTANWSTAQTVTVRAAPDADTLDGTTIFDHSATSSDAAYNNIAVRSVTAYEVDTGTPGITVVPTNLSVPEGGSQSYAVSLNTAPSGFFSGVTVIITQSGDSDLSADQQHLVFQNHRWNIAQTVTVSAAHDSDMDNGKANFTHVGFAPSGSVYRGVRGATVTATEVDSGRLGVTVAPTALAVSEGGNSNYTVVLDTQPTGDVTITVSHSGDDDLSASATDLTFTTDNWSTAQTVTVSAEQDDDSDAGKAIFAHAAIGSGYDDVTVDSVEAIEADDDAPGVTVAPTTLSISEDTSRNYAVKLNTRPTGDVTIAITRMGDSDVSASATVLTFTTGNWSTAQSVTLTAVKDDDAFNGIANFAHTPTGGGYGGVAAATVTATEIDDDAAGVTVFPTELMVPEGDSQDYFVVLDTEPSDVVTIAVDGSGDTDLSTLTTNLTFSTDTWNIPQKVTVAAKQDDDTVNGTATFAHTPSGGGYDSVPAASVTATEVDNDTAGVTVSPKSLLVLEGSVSSYTVVLDTKPTGDVSVSVAHTGDEDLSASTTGLTFTTDNWNVAQLVRVSARDDDDDDDGTATFAHTPSGGGYNGVKADSVDATEDDNDTRGVTVDPTELSVPEGGTRIYTVVLDTVPSGDVTVAIGRTADSDDDLSASTAALTFATANWNTAQTVTVSAATDADADNGTATFSHTATGADYGGVVAASVVATEIDDETPGITVAPTELSVPEDGSQNYTVVLDARPSGNVTVAVARNSGGDSDLSASTSALTFTTGNWNAAQTVTVSAQPDDDADNGTATFSHTVTGANYGGVEAASVAATEADDDIRGVAVDPTVLAVSEGGNQNYTVKLNTRPSGEVTVSVTRTGDGDLSASATALTFTTANWNAAQTVTVTAQADDDADNGRAIFAHDASGGGYGAVTAASVVATEIDDETRGVTVAPTALAVPEGGSRAYTVVLDTRPSGNVTISVGRTGDGDLSASPTALTFTTANWNAAQTVAVSAQTDDDTDNGTATFSHTAEGGGYGGVTVDSVTATEGRRRRSRGHGGTKDSVDSRGQQPHVRRGPEHEAVRQRDGYGRADRRPRLYPIALHPDLHHRQLERCADDDRARRARPGHRIWHRDLHPHADRRRL